MNKNNFICEICDSKESSIIAYPQHGIPSSALNFEQVIICGRCGIGKASPLPSQKTLNAFYENGDYWQGVAEENPYQIAHEKNQASWRVTKCLPHLTNNKPKSRVLDIGAGHGWIAYWLEQFAFDRVARFDFIEPDETLSRNNITENYGFSVHKLKLLEQCTEKYDLIFLNHVLEHVADPIDFITKIKSLLTPEGIVFIEVPHSDYRFKDNVFPHTYFFTTRSFHYMADLAEVETLSCQAFGQLPKIGKDQIRGWLGYFLQVAFTLAVHLKLSRLQELIDNRIWRYSKISSDGVWLQWIFRTKKL